MQKINYEKYSNMTQRQILNSLINAQKQEQKIKKQMQEKLLEKQELIKFLKAKIKESLDKPKYNFVPYRQSEAFKIGREREKARTAEEQIKLTEEVKKEINMDYNNEL